MRTGLADSELEANLPLLVVDERYLVLSDFLQNFAIGQVIGQRDPDVVLGDEATCAADRVEARQIRVAVVPAEPFVADFAWHVHVLRQYGAFVVLGRQQDKVIEEQALLRGDVDGPMSGIHHHRRRLVAVDSGDRQERWSAGGLEVDLELLLHLGWIVRADGDDTEDRFIVGIHVAQDHTIERGLADIDAQHYLILQSGEHGVAFPTVAREQVLREAIADATTARCPAILGLVLILVQSGEVVRLQGLLARQARDSRLTRTLAGLFVAYRAHRTADVAGAV